MRGEHNDRDYLEEVPMKNQVLGKLRYWVDVTVCAAVLLAVIMCVGSPAAAQSTNGSAGQMPAYYDDQLFTINFMLLPAGTVVLSKNTQTNLIFMSDQFESLTGTPFTSVLNAITGAGRGFNPLWQEVQIVFRDPVTGAATTPRQFTKDDDILTAATQHQITLVFTLELYRCAVVGPK
jgi:hypothetical protein